MRFSALLCDFLSVSLSRCLYTTSALSIMKCMPCSAVIPYGSAIYYQAKYDMRLRALMTLLMQVFDTFLQLKKKQELKRAAVDTHTHTPSKTNINNIPEELIYEVMSFMDAASLVAAAQVSIRWSHYSNQEELWTNLLLKNFNLSVDALQERNYNKRMRRKQLPPHTSPHIPPHTPPQRKNETLHSTNAKSLYRDMRQSFWSLIHVEQHELSSLPTVPASFIATHL